MPQQPNNREYRLTMPVDVSDELKRIAAENDTSVTDVMRAFVALGVINCNGTPIYAEKDGEYKEIELFPKKPVPQ